MANDHLTKQHGEEQWALHTYRYEFANRFVEVDDKVLDAACGIGYGQEILSCQYWVGADRLDSADQFTLQVDLRTWAPDFSYDVFVGLETIEHIDPLDAYVAAAKRADRVIVISTPIIPTCHFNQDHVHDFTRESLEALFSDWRVSVYKCPQDPGAKDGNDAR